MALRPERWQQIASIYDLVVAGDPTARDRLLAEACAGDEELRQEVESLLRAEAAPVIIDDSLWATAATLFSDQAGISPGSSLGPYRIDARLGAGGMGEVFSATDTRLDRRVAIKVLPDGMALDRQVRARFTREAKAVAALTHPHICTLHDIGSDNGVDFLVMEYLEGDTLDARLKRERLTVDEALHYAIEIASALDHAHSHGIIHRDLKPGNVILTPGGAKLLDFGLAKFRPVADSGATTAGAAPAGIAVGTLPDDAVRPGDSGLTRNGAILGTLRYMAPERFEGQEADEQSDVFSFGALLFEMLTGRPAFEGDSPAAVRASILDRQTPPVAVREPAMPPAVDEIVGRCLARDRAVRWPAAADVRHALQQIRTARAAGPTSRMASRLTAASAAVVFAGIGAWLWIGGVGPRPTVEPASRIRTMAVLPLEDVSGGAEEYFADGVTDQLIANLATIRGLHVIARTSVMPYRRTDKPAPAIARELYVDGLVEGTILRAGDNVRMMARLIDGLSGVVLWEQTFDSDVRGALPLQRQVAEAILEQVGLSLTPAERARLAHARPVDPDVQRQVLLGRHHAARATEEDLRAAIGYFDAAIATDPLNATAHAGLAEVYMGLSGYYLPPREAMPKAKQAAARSLRLDDSLADAHAAIGFVNLVYDWDGPAAETALRRALDLNPTLATARLHYAAYLTTQARHDDAVQQIRLAVEFDPASIRTNAIATSLLLFARRYDDAIELARKGLEFEPGSGFALAFQGVAYAEQGRFTEAVDNMERATRLDSSPTILALQAHVLAVAGQKAEAARLIRRLEESARTRYFCPYEIGAAHVSLGDADAAYRWFRKGIEDRADCMAWLGVEPWLAPFRSDPRYRSLLREIGLDPH